MGYILDKSLTHAHSLNHSVDQLIQRSVQSGRKLQVRQLNPSNIFVLQRDIVNDCSVLCVGHCFLMLVTL